MNNKFAATTRLQASTIEFPRVAQRGPLKMLTAKNKNATNVTSLTRMPSKSSCEEMLACLTTGRFNSIACQIGTFNQESLQTILNIHCLREVACNVQKEREWLAKTIVPPNEKCSLSKSFLKTYENLILNVPDGRSVLAYYRYILASDMALLAGKRWLNYSILAGVIKLLQEEQNDTSVFMLNDLIQMDRGNVRRTIQRCKKRTRYVTLIANVGKSSEVFFGTPQRPGCHWTLIYIDFNRNKWYYCDSYAWGSPQNIKEVLSPIIEIFHEERTLPRKPFGGCVQGHVPTKRSSHVCSV